MAQEMKYEAAEEAELMKEIWSPEISDNPYKFVKLVFPWGKVNTPLTKFKGPRKWQKDILLEIAEHIRKNRGRESVGGLMDVMRMAVSSGRGIGKSALVSWLILWMISTRIGSTTVVSANSEAQLRSVTWGELTKWQAMMVHSHWFEISATKLAPAKWLCDLVERDLAKGTRYWHAEGKLWSEENPDSYAGVHNHDGMLLVFDESSGIPQPIWDVGSGFFTEDILDRYWFAFSNPRRNEGAFYECFHAKRNFWNTRKIDARKVEGTDKAVYEQIIAEHGEDSRQARIEVYGEFPLQGDDQFISAAVVDECMERKAYNDPTAPICIGVDVARFGADKSAIAVRKGRDIVALRKFQGYDTMQIVGEVIKAINEFKPIMTTIDEGGLGAGVIDRLLEQQYRVRAVNFGSKADNPVMWGNKRAEMWGEMREWLKTAHLPKDDELRADLTGPTYRQNSMGAILLERKEDMRRRGAASPDCFIAGTMIDTPEGGKSIESFVAGDKVSTPFGTAKVVFVHETVAESITTVSFSNGAILSGKGAHKIFTFDSGWVRMDALSLTNDIESSSIWRKFKWKFLNASFIRMNRFSFKHQVDTISLAGKIRRRDFFIGASGLTALGLFLKGIAYIIRMEIGKIMMSATLNLSRLLSTPEGIQQKTCQTRNSEKKLLDIYLLLHKKRLNGTNLQKDWNGIQKMEQKHGLRGKSLILNALYVEKNTKHSSRFDLTTVLGHVGKRPGILGIKRLLANALTAATNLFTSSIKFNRIVPVSVQTSIGRQKTYNLTLDTDNVYYANGILVENCGDAVCISFAYPVAWGASSRKIVYPNMGVV